MQAKLELSEFTYLLHTLNARQAVGVDNALFFPDDDVIRESLLHTGFETLKTHGWLTPQDNGWHMSTRLAMLVAVIATPETVVTITRSAPAGGRQIVTYYVTQSIYVEQFRTTDEQYLLTQLETETDLVGRLQAAFQIPIAAPWTTPVSLPTAVLDKAIDLARAGNLSLVFPLLDEFGVEDNQLAELLVGLRPMGDLEFATLQGNQLVALRDMVILEGADSSKWSMDSHQESGEVTFQPFNTEQLAARIRSGMSAMNAQPPSLLNGRNQGSHP